MTENIQTVEEVVTDLVARYIDDGCVPKNSRINAENYSLLVKERSPEFAAAVAKDAHLLMRRLKRFGLVK